MPPVLSRLEISSQSATIHTLCVDAPDTNAQSPVLLFLHGKGEFGLTPDYLPMVLRNMSPGFRAIQEQLRSVSVVSPQFPSDTDDWNWNYHLPAVAQFLEGYAQGRRLVATGFSRGGRGVLQLDLLAPKLITRWAIIDPQRADDDEAKKLVARASATGGWIRHGDHIKKNTPFAEAIRKALDPLHAVRIDLKHGELAQKGYAGDLLGGASNLYQFLDLEFTVAA